MSWLSKLFLPPRNLRDELLDLDEAPYDEVRDSLRDVALVNRYLSGYRVLLYHVGPFLKNHKADRPFTILDAAKIDSGDPSPIEILLNFKTVLSCFLAIINGYIFNNKLFF